MPPVGSKGVINKIKKILFVICFVMLETKSTKIIKNTIEEYEIFEKIKSTLLNKMYDIYEDSLLKILESSMFAHIQYIQLVAGFISTFLVVGGRIN